MADYFPLISRAVAGLTPNGKEQREAIYARAREALMRQLTSLDPPIPEADLWRERNSLEETIRRVEAEYTPKMVSTVRPELKPDAASVPIQPPKPSANAPAAGAAKPPPPAVPARTTEPQGRPQPVIVDPTDTDSPPPASAPASGAAVRPKISMTHGARLGSLRATVVAIVLPAMLALGSVAYILRDDPAIFERKADAAVAGDPVAAQRKNESRLDGTGAPPTPAGQQPRTPPRGQAALPVAARAVFFEETAAEPRGVQSDGQVIWRIETVSGGQASETAIRGSAMFPNANMGLEIVINRNRDAQLPATHTIEIVFRPEGGRDGVAEIGPIEARDQEAQPGYQLRGAMAPIGANLFLIGLDRTAASERNIQALRDERFFAFQFRLTSGKVGALLLEKGPTGDRVFREAFDIWAQ